MLDCRCILSDFSLQYGGNIGYSVLPTERREGYAKEILKLALLEYKKIGTNKVLLCCDPENIGSKNTIISNGGILENEIEDTHHFTKSGIIQRYWINLENLK